MSYQTYEPPKDEVHFTVHVNIKKITKTPTGTTKTDRDIEEIVSVVGRAETLETAIEHANRHLYVYLPFDEDVSDEDLPENKKESV